MGVFMGSIMTFGFPFAPNGWAQCNGQTMNVSQYNALYALLGVIYGGTVSQNFKLPDLQGRVPINQGTGGNLTNRVISTASGVEKVTVAIANMPAHVHQMSTLTATTTFNLAAQPSLTGSIVPTTTNCYLGGTTAGPTSAHMLSPDLGTGTPVVQKGVSTAISGTMLLDDLIYQIALAIDQLQIRSSRMIERLYERIVRVT